MPPVEALRQSFIKKMIRPSRFFCSLPLCRRRLAIPSFVRASMTKSFVIRGKMLWSSLSNFIVMPMSRCNDGWHDIVQDATLISDQRTFAAWENAFASLDPFQFQSTILLHFQWWISWIFARREVQLRGFLISSGTICMATCCDVRKKGVFIRDWRFSSSFQRIFCCCNRGGPRLHFPCKAALFNDCSFLSDGTEKTSTFPSHPLKVENWLIIWHLRQKSCEVSFRKCCQCYSTWRAQARRETNVFCSVTDYYEFLDHQFTLSWCYLLPVARS